MTRQPTWSGAARWVHGLIGHDNGERGDYDWLVDPQRPRVITSLVFVCPGCKLQSVIRVGPVKEPGTQQWQWNLNKDTPTLIPSIHHVGCWHGHLTAGRFVSC